MKMKLKKEIHLRHRPRKDKFVHTKSDEEISLILGKLPLRMCVDDE